MPFFYSLPAPPIPHLPPFPSICLCHTYTLCIPFSSPDKIYISLSSKLVSRNKICWQYSIGNGGFYYGRLDPFCQYIRRSVFYFILTRLLQTVHHNAYAQDPYAQEFGIKISEKLASVEARILPPPWVIVCSLSCLLLYCYWIYLLSVFILNCALLV